jgi:hypothetical protein
LIEREVVNVFLMILEGRVVHEDIQLTKALDGLLNNSAANVEIGAS